MGSLDVIDDLDDEQLGRLYTYPAGLTVRGNAISSLDGGATTDGTSGGLGGPGDRRLFALQQDEAYRVAAPSSLGADLKALLGPNCLPG